MFEHRRQPLLSRPAFWRRMGRSAFISGLMIGGSLGIGVLGYRFTADLDWIDALLNASMILTGMGPVSPLHTTSSKLFASAYALFSGVVFIASMGLVIAPVAHRLLHKLHLEAAAEQGDGDDGNGQRSAEGSGDGGDRAAAAASKQVPRRVPPRR